jgi:hypothetical protein
VPQRQQDRSDRGAVTLTPLSANARRCKSIPESAAPRVARNMRAIQRLAGSKHDARAHWAHLLFPTRPTPWSALEFRNYLMLQPCSHYPKVC